MKASKNPLWLKPCSCALAHLACVAAAPPSYRKGKRVIVEQAYGLFDGLLASGLRPATEL